MVVTSTAFGQTVSDNLLLNPGAEDRTNPLSGWGNLQGSIGWDDDSTRGTGNNYFTFYSDNERAEQKVSVSSFASSIDSGYAEAVIGGWIYTAFSDSSGGMGVRFLDSLGFDIRAWEQGGTFSQDRWRELRYRVSIPPKTRTIALNIFSEKDRVYFDDLSLQILVTTPPTPTPTITPIPAPELPTPIPGPETIQPSVVYSFNEPTATGNNLLIFPPVAVRQFNLSDISFRPLTTSAGDDVYTDGFGILLAVDPGEGATFYGKPLTVDGDYVFLRLSARSSEANVSLAVGALDAVEAENIAGANLNGSIGVNILLDSTRFVDKFGYLEALYKPERGTIVPVFQVTNASESEQAIIQLDNLEIYQIPPQRLLIPMLSSPAAKIMGFLQTGNHIAE